MNIMSRLIVMRLLGAFLSMMFITSTLLVTTSAVIGETVTVLSHRRGQALARHFLDVIQRSQLPIIYIDEQLHQKALEVFKQQTARGTSYVDCSNVTVMQQFSITTIFSFDRVYSKIFQLKVAA